MKISADKGLFVYASTRKPRPSEANPQFVETAHEMSPTNARIGGGAYLSDRVEKE